MRVTVKLQELKDIIGVMGWFVSRHATLPVLENIYIKAGVDGLVFRATDMEKYIEVELEASPDDEASLTIPAKMLWDILKTVDDESITLVIEQSTHTMTILTSADEFKIKWIPATEYVALPSLENPETVIVDIDQYITGVSKVEYAVTEKNFSPVLTWIYIRLKQEQDQTYIIFVWTDSFRLAEYKLPYEWSSSSMKLLIPKTHIQDLQRVAQFCADKGASHTTIKYANNMVEFRYEVEKITITSSALLIQWSFPDYEQESIMPTSYTSKALIDASQFGKAIQKIEILTRDLNNYISVSSTLDSLQLASWATDRWNAQTSVPAYIEWPEFSYWVNWKYVTDILKHTQSAEALMQIIDWEQPIIFKDSEDPAMTYVVRPLVK